MMRAALILAAGLALPVAEPLAAQSEPVSAERVADHVELVRIADAIDAAVDAKDWTRARSFFADEIEVDFTALTGGDPATIPADALIEGWSGNLTEEKASFHLRGNHQIAWDGTDAARMTSHGYAWNRLERGLAPENGGAALWEVWGVYEHDFTRLDDGWSVSAMRFFPTAQRGSDFVRDTPGQ